MTGAALSCIIYKEASEGRKMGETNKAVDHYTDCFDCHRFTDDGIQGEEQFAGDLSFHDSDSI